MSDRVFERALSPDQMREALLLLDGAVRTKAGSLPGGEPNLAEAVDRGADQAGTTMATDDRLAAAADPQQRKKRLNLVFAFCALGITAAAALTLLPGSDQAPTPAALPGIADEQPANPQPALVKNASPALPVTGPKSDQSSYGSERRQSKPEVAGSGPAVPTDRGDDQPAVKDATDTASAIPHSGQTVAVAGIAAMQTWWDERASRRPREVPPYAAAIRTAAAKKRFWRHHRQPVAQISGRECFFAACLPSEKRRVFYEPPRTVTQ